jgi:acetylornithine deacetylase/succinyl-diaminopimelate desuccinylase family protein
MINKKRLINLTRKLVQIDSQNPPGDESSIATFVKGYLGRLGVDSRTVEFKKNRPNIIAKIKGQSAKELLITPHLDTVPAGRSWKRAAPFSATILNGRIYGLGATDCKSNLAVAMEAINSLIESKIKLPYTLIFAATADEETGSDLGLIPLLQRNILRPDAAVVLDADDFDIVVSQKGLIHMTVKIQGKRAHGAYPWRGINAIDIAIDAIKEIKNMKFSRSKHRHLRPPTINVGTVRGGDKVNIVADWCEFELDFRLLPGDSANRIIRQVKGVLGKYSKKHKVQIQGIQQPYNIPESHSLVRCLRGSAAKFKIVARVKGSEGATVITFFQHKGIPAVATGYGCGGCAHTADEYVRIENLYKGALMLEDFLKNYSFNRN